MIRSELSTVINAPPEKVFARVSDPMHMVADWPSVIAVKDIEGEGVGRQFRVVSKMLGMQFEVEVTCTEFVPDRRLAAEFTGGITGKDAYTIEPHDGGTKVSWAVECTIPVPSIRKIAEPLLKKQNEREGPIILANLKACIEAEIGTTA